MALRVDHEYMATWKAWLLGAAAITSGALTVTLVLLAILVDWETADRTASVFGAVASLLGMVISLRALLGDTQQGSVLRVKNTGKATSKNSGKANTGLTGPGANFSGEVEVDSTGDSDADGGSANTGVWRT